MITITHKYPLYRPYIGISHRIYHVSPGSPVSPKQFVAGAGMIHGSQGFSTNGQSLVQMDFLGKNKFELSLYLYLYTNTFTNT